MTNFNNLSKKPSQFLSLTGYTVEEFLALLSPFTLKFQEYLEFFTFAGKPRQKRKYVEYKNASLPLKENKLLFILIYLKGNERQESLAERFRMSQPKANRWIHLLHKVLNQTLNEMEMLPARDIDHLEQKLKKQTEETVTLNTIAEVEIESCSTIAFDSMTEAEVESCDTIAEDSMTEAEVESDDTIAEDSMTEAEVESCDTIAEDSMTETEVESCDTIAEDSMTEAEVESCDTIAEDSMTEAEVESCDTIAEDFLTEVEVEICDTIAEEDMIEIDLYFHDGTERPINRSLDKELPKIL